MFKIIKTQLHKGIYDDVSLNVIGKRWGQWFDEIPELSDDELDKDRELLAMDDQRCQQFIG
ncbi:hypothetical protein V3H41_15910 [Vibrio parahaemolyticus]|uniref:hypothetical protein n=1 Tax=Vibrio parahaemolyticus TaxID=670 RepID=UPI0008FC5191|nr:hypothetical protein FORC22_0370 [Vibrio parahaemolyticus]EJC6972509.1 hypothetical protein [Vibrio parahaemolyticus]EJC7150380.1 hypothetical protein [Vibrio parahaemolyticus]